MQEIDGAARPRIEPVKKALQTMPTLAKMIEPLRMDGLLPLQERCFQEVSAMATAEMAKGENQTVSEAVVNLIGMAIVHLPGNRPELDMGSIEDQHRALQVRLQKNIESIAKNTLLGALGAFANGDAADLLEAVHTGVQEVVRRQVKINVDGDIVQQELVLGAYRKVGKFCETSFPNVPANALTVASKLPELWVDLPHFDGDKATADIVKKCAFGEKLSSSMQAFSNCQSPSAEADEFGALHSAYYAFQQVELATDLADSPFATEVKALEAAAKSHVAMHANRSVEEAATLAIQDWIDFQSKAGGGSSAEDVWSTPLAIEEAAGNNVTWSSVKNLANMTILTIQGPAFSTRLQQFVSKVRTLTTRLKRFEVGAHLDQPEVAQQVKQMQATARRARTTIAEALLVKAMVDNEHDPRQLKQAIDEVFNGWTIKGQSVEDVCPCLLNIATQASLGKPLTV